MVDSNETHIEDMFIELPLVLLNTSVPLFCHPQLLSFSGGLDTDTQKGAVDAVS